MAYITGSVTDANPGPALYALMAPALTTAGLTLVDTVTISTRTHKVWKSAAANNTQGLDWYLDIGYTTTGAGTITLQPFEFYDPATDLGYRGGVSVSSTVIDATTFSRYGATGSALETNWMGSTSYSGYPTALVTSAFGYWVSATGDRVMMLLGNDATRVTYVGFYQPDSLYAAKAGAALYPLVGASLYPGAPIGTSATQGSVTAALTRLPPVTTLAGSGWGTSLSIPVLTTSQSGSYPQLPAGSTLAYPLVALPIEMLVATSSAALSTRFGTLRDVALIPASGTVRGDTVTISGAQWVLSSSAGSQSVLFKAA